MKLKVYVDGSCHNNPKNNKMGIGVYVPKLNFGYGHFVGYGTSAMAEMNAMIYGLLVANNLIEYNVCGVRSLVDTVEMISDNQFVVRLLRHEQHTDIDFYDESKTLITDYVKNVMTKSVQYTWTQRDNNKEADKLAGKHRRSRFMYNPIMQMSYELAKFHEKVRKLLHD